MMNNPSYDNDWDTADLSDIPPPRYDDVDDIEMADVNIHTMARSTPSAAQEEVRNAVEHDQLPTVEEYKTAAAAHKKKKKKHARSGKHHKKTASQTEDVRYELHKSKTVILAVTIPILLGLIFIITGVVVAVRNNKNNGSSAEPLSGAPAPEMETSPPTPAPTEPPTRASLVLKKIVEYGWSSEQTVTNPSNPQYQAAMWIANDDVTQYSLDNGPRFQQRYAAAVLYFAWGGDFWNKSLGWLEPSNSICLWNNVVQVEDGNPLTHYNTTTSIDGELRIGLICDCPMDELHGEHMIDGIDCLEGTAPVQKIILPTVGLSGTIPSEIGLFENLTTINLYSNNLIWSIPSEITQLSLLQSLKLHKNQLTGTLPENMGDLGNCSDLVLADNQLGGTFPESMVNMSSLATLNLNNNNFVGPLSSLSMENLQALFVQNNILQERLTEEQLRAWSNINVLDLSGNHLNGSLPENLFRIPTLAIVDLHNNDFIGEMPEVPDKMFVDSELPLQFLALQQNPKLTGSISSTLGNLLELQHLDLSNNQFGGLIPPELKQLTALQYLNLNNNDQLEPRAIPTWLGQLTSLVNLSMKHTRRTGSIPTELGKLSNLLLLDLEQNQLDSEIPEELGNCGSLKYVLLSRNQLEGGLPESFKNLGSMSVLLLNDNNLKESVESVCDPNTNALKTFYADCSEISSGCSCCTVCCFDDTTADADLLGTCQMVGGDGSSVPVSFVGDEDSVWDDLYVRSHFRSYDNLIILPDFFN